eukprot:g105.t1
MCALGKVAVGEGSTSCVAAAPTTDALPPSIVSLKLLYNESGGSIDHILQLTLGVPVWNPHIAKERVSAGLKSPPLQNIFIDWSTDRSFPLEGGEDGSSYTKRSVFNKIELEATSFTIALNIKEIGAKSVYQDVIFFRAFAEVEANGLQMTEYSTVTESWTVARDCALAEYLRVRDAASPMLFYCFPCPFGATCNGDITGSDIRARYGYRRLSWNISVFGACPFQHACHGVRDVVDADGRFISVGSIMPESETDTRLQENETAEDIHEGCAEFHTGELCASCVQGSYVPFRGGFCTICPEQGQNTALFTVALVLPVAVTPLILLAWKAASLFKRIPLLFDKAIATVIIFYYLVFHSIVKRLAINFSCQTFGAEDFGGNARQLLSMDLNTACYSPQHNTFILAAALPAFLLYLLILPFAMTVTLYRLNSRGMLHPHDANFQPNLTVRYGFLFSGYEPQYSWWEVIVLLRKASFVIATISMQAYGAPAQVLVAILVLGTAALINTKYTPYDHDDHDTLESMSLQGSTAMLTVALLCNEISRAKNIKAGIISEDAALGEMESIAMAVLIFGCTLS